MANSRDRWGDEGGGPGNQPRRRDSSGTSTTTVVLLVLGGLFVVGVLGCGGLALFWYRTAAVQREAMVEAMQADEQAHLAEQAARRANDAALDPDGVPLPKPGGEAVPDPPPQPPAAAFPTDAAGDPARWRVLFRSKDPARWNTFTNTPADFALPVRLAPADTRYLRLRRMDTGDAIIVPMTRARVGRADPAGPAVRWNGEGKEEHGGYHLGIAEGPVARFNEGTGTIGVLMDGFDASPGSGFGHAHHVEDGGQRFTWQGKEIPPTAFEVAVTAAELTAAEKKWLKE